MGWKEAARCKQCEGLLARARVESEEARRLENLGRGGRARQGVSVAVRDVSPRSAIVFPTVL